MLPILLGDDFVTRPWMLVALPMGLIAALTGHTFVSSLIGMRARAKELRVPSWLKPALGGLGTGIIGLAVYYWTASRGHAQTGVFSIGYDSLVGAFGGHYPLVILLALFAGKFIATQIAYSSGGSGGLFSPTLFLGGMLDGIFGILVTALAPQAAWMGVDDPAHVTGACVLLGMGAMFASVVRCPLTSLIMIFEMTRNYSLILPLMAGNMLSYYLARNLRRVSLYNALLLQDGITLRRMPSYQGAQDYQNLPVAAIMTHDVVCLDGTRGPGENLARLRTLDRKFHGYPVTSNGVFQSVIMHRELEQAARESPDKSLAELTDGQKTEWISPDTSIRDAARLMIARDYGQLPVCSPSDSGKLLGWITLNDIARQQNAVDLALERR